MWIYQRARDIMLYPKDTWEKIKLEKSLRSLVLYVIGLNLIPALSVYIGFGLIGVRMGFGYYKMSWINAIYSALVTYSLNIIGVVAVSFLFLIIANYFQAETDYWHTLKLAAYSATAPLLAGIFQLIPDIKILSVMGLYGAYLVFLGAPKLIKSPADKEQTLAIMLIIGGIILAALINHLSMRYIDNIFYFSIMTY